ncbi:hypothetical protein BX666DRAFT_1941568 [Dichotomocladium elegans]|nr:hypothetical protein BX666DRAFT_1941568 [Dichotomocladium elegans]
MEEDGYQLFKPSLWRQRRSFILEILQKHNVTSVLDYGCGEGSVLSFLIPPTSPITRLAGVDICTESLQEVVQSCQPWPADYTHLRENPLTIDIYHGSVDQYDERLGTYEAIVCSEVIEHLYTPTLDHILETTLGQYQPRIMIMTTPNAEYNIYFDSLNYNTPDATFRHEDHKFEWTRKEFQAWCEAGAKKYGYSVEFYGIGLMEGMCHDTSVGHCTQACVFVRACQTQQQVPLPSQRTSHRLVRHIEFPYLDKDEALLDERQALQEIEDYIAILCRPFHEENDKSCHFKTMDNDIADPALEWHSDWAQDVDLSLSPSPLPPSIDEPSIMRKSYSSVPQRFALSILWDIPRVRQICKKQSYLVQLLLRERAGDYEVKDADLVVLKKFEYDNEEDVSVRAGEQSDDD